MSTLVFGRFDADNTTARLQLRLTSKTKLWSLQREYVEDVELFVFGRQDQVGAFQDFDSARATVCAAAREWNRGVMRIANILERSSVWDLNNNGCGFELNGGHVDATVLAHVRPGVSTEMHVPSLYENGDDLAMRPR